MVEAALRTLERGEAAADGAVDSFNENYAHYATFVQNLVLMAAAISILIDHINGGS